MVKRFKCMNSIISGKEMTRHDEVNCMERDKSLDDSQVILAWSFL